MHDLWFSSVAARRVTPWVAGLCLVQGLLALAGCGQKGPLTLPAAPVAASAATR